MCYYFITKGGVFMSKGKLIAIAVLAIFIIGSCFGCFDDGGSDYYVDYNHNGKADKGEHAYHENKDGEIDFWY